MKNTYEDIKQNLEQIVDKRDELKHKVRRDTTLTSSHIKEMQSLRTKSTDRVRLVEQKQDQALTHLESLTAVLNRSKEVEK